MEVLGGKPSVGGQEISYEHALGELSRSMMTVAFGLHVAGSVWLQSYPEG